MSNDPKKDPAKDTADKPTAERLIDVAGEIFAAKGTAATVREICSAAGCSVASINYYFGDKLRLYARCIEEACERKQRLFPLPTTDAAGCDDAARLLQVFLRAVTARIAGEANVVWQSTIILRELLSPSGTASDALRKYLEPDFRRLERLLSNLVGPELDAPVLLRSLATQILARCMFLRTGRNLRAMLGVNEIENESPEMVADEICSSILLQVNALRVARNLPPLCYRVTDDCHLATAAVAGAEGISNSSPSIGTEASNTS